MPRRIAPVLVIILWMAPCISRADAPADEFDRVREIYTKRRAAILRTAKAKQDELLSQYRHALAKLADECQEAGDLDGVLATQQEMKRLIGATAADGPSTAPERLGKYRRTYEREQRAIQTRRYRQMVDLAEAYAEKMDELAQDLTRADQLATAKNAREEALAAHEVATVAAEKLAALKPEKDEKTLAELPGEPVRVLVSCDETFEMAVNGKLICSGRGGNATTATIRLQDDDLITVKVGNKNSSNGFAMAMIRESDGAVTVTNTRDWRAYEIDAGEEWLDREKTSRPRKHAIHATNQGWKDSVDAAAGVKTEAIWSPYSNAQGYLWYRVDMRDFEQP